jgi:hypothetical protein
MRNTSINFAIWLRRPLRMKLKSTIVKPFEPFTTPMYIQFSCNEARRGGCLERTENKITFCPLCITDCRRADRPLGSCRVILASCVARAIPFLDKLMAGTSSPDAVALTFDDGYVSNIVAGKPRLAAADVPATVFLATTTPTDIYGSYIHER